MTVLHKLNLRQRRKQRIRKKISGTAQCPRMTIFKSNMALYAQLIDDVSSTTLVWASSLKDKKCNVEMAQKIGAEIAKKAIAKKIGACVFDRNGYRFHGIVKSFADAAREGGIKF
jgi:large subunit ribosomal protein L18